MAVVARRHLAGKNGVLLCREGHSCSASFSLAKKTVALDAFPADTVRWIRELAEEVQEWTKTQAAENGDAADLSCTRMHHCLQGLMQQGTLGKEAC